jgi:Copper amine oxidase N-terminal domain
MKCWDTGLRTLAGMSLAGLFALPLAAVAATVTIDGKPVDGAISQAGAILIPFRVPMEQIGAVVVWSDGDQSGVASLNGTELIRTKIGDPTAYIRGNAKALTAAPVLVDKLEFVPVEILPEISSATVAYSPDHQTATVTSFDSAGIDATAAGLAAAVPKNDWWLPIVSLVIIAVIVKLLPTSSSRKTVPPL